MAKNIFFYVKRLTRLLWMIVKGLTDYLVPLAFVYLVATSLRGDGEMRDSGNEFDLVAHDDSPVARGGYSLYWPIRGGSTRKGYLFQVSGI